LFLHPFSGTRLPVIGEKGLPSSFLSFRSLASGYLPLVPLVPEGRIRFAFLSRIYYKKSYKINYKMVNDPIQDKQNYVDFVLNYVDLRVAPIG